MTTPETRSPTETEVWIWEAALDCGPDQLASYASVLNDHERARAARLRPEDARRRHVAASGILRHILARHVPRLPENLRFAYGPKGKPHLQPGLTAPGIHFNMSHSGDTLMVAVAQHGEIGVDVELMDHSVDITQFVRRHFTPQERVQMESLRANLRPRAFFNWWTRKEALLKGLGVGLSLPLDSFEISFLPGDPPRVHWFKDHPDLPDRWSLIQLETGPQVVATLAVEGPPPKVLRQSFTGPY